MRTQPTGLVLLGHPVGHSLSPVFQRAAISAAGLNASYEALDVAPEGLEDAVARLRAAGAGGNVTVPHKERFAALCDRLTPLAARVGAVNTFWTESGKLVGDNTDVGGFDRAARELLGEAPQGLVVGVIGAGGAAAAVLAVVEGWAGSRALVSNRTPARAAAMVGRFRSIAVISDVARIASEAELVVNATTVGMRGDDLPIDPRTLFRARAVMDLVYRQGDTPFVVASRAVGIRAIGGLPMLLEQGALAFERWFGMEADRSKMAEAVAG